MAVYVDSLGNWGWKHGPSCHLLADSEDELHAFAGRLGMRRSWFQPKSFPHYDLTSSRRQDAVAMGAQEIDNRTLVDKMRSLRAEKLP